MMTSDLARETYQQIEVNSSNGLQLVVMLYDGAIRFLRDAKACIQTQDLNGKAVAIDRTLAILGELQSTLKLEEGGELAQSLDRLYTYMTERIVEASLKLNVKPLDETIKLLTILNSAWTEIATKTEQVQIKASPVTAGAKQDTEAGRPLEIFG
jgi:flagellar protein FliS